jgi:ubiquinone/menaquinone biosynthesis C-methylase UbiE
MVSALGWWAIDPGAVLAEARRILRPAGRVSISDIASNVSYRPPAAVRAWCDAAGLEMFERFGNALAYTMNGRKPMRTASG